MEKFFNLETINPNLVLLQERFEEIREEFLRNKENLFLMNFGAEAGYYMNSAVAYKGWKVAPLYGTLEDVKGINGSASINNNHLMHIAEIDEDLVKIKVNTQLLPILTQTLIESGIRKRVGISVVYPGKEILWHRDLDPEKENLAIVRGLFGLDVVEEEGKESSIYMSKDDDNIIEKRVFKNNEFVFFWGRTKHRVENNLSAPRYMICFDHEIPYESLLNS
jgi:hypothetical protein